MAAPEATITPPITHCVPHSPPEQVSVPQTLPVASGLQSLVLTAGWQLWQMLLEFTVPDV